MTALFLFVLVSVGYGSAERVKMPPRTAFAERASAPGGVNAQIGPFAGVGSGVRRIDLEPR